MLFNHGRLPTPFGGPASGLWPSGGGASPLPPRPPPPPQIANIFSDCFGGCSGTITQIAPGPVCGWKFFQSPLGAAGPVVLAPGVMTFQAPTSNEAPAVYKDIVLSSIKNLTVQFVFQEFADLGASSSYFIVITDAGNADVLSIELGANGDVDVLLGPQGNASVYEGIWTPNKGKHTVHVTVNGTGVPRVWVDGVEIPMPFIVGGLVFAGYSMSAVTANFADLNGPGPALSATLTGLFITSGQLPPDTVFRCP